MFQKTLGVLAVLSAVTISGCAELNSGVVQTDGGPIEKEVRVHQVPTRMDASIRSAAQIDEPTGTIMLRDAVAYALIRSPELQAFALEVRAAEARRLQASLLPNPEIEVEVEEFGGTGERRRFDSSETTIQLGQLVELAGKRSKRTHLAAIEKDLAGWGYQSARLDVMNQVTQAFIDALAAQEQLALAEELVRLAEQGFFAVTQRVQAGKDSPVEETKAKVVLSTARIELEKAKQSLASARYRLTATWAGRTPTFQKVEGAYYEAAAMPSLDQLIAMTSQNPDVARWATEKTRRQAALELEKTKATSDIGLRGGVQYFDEGDDAAVIVGLSIPVPLFDRNQGRIQEATYMLAKTEEDRKAVEMKVRTILAGAAQALSCSSAEVAALREDVLPAARSAFDATSEGYRLGKFSYLDVLDAQRTFFEVKGKYIKSLATYHKARAEVERLIGQSLESLNNLTRSKVEENK